MRHVINVFIALMSLGLSACSTVNTVSPLSTVLDSASSTLVSNIPGNENPALNDLMGCNGSLAYFPMPNFEARDYTFVEPSETGRPTVKKEKFPTSTLEVNKLLPNLAMDVSVQELGTGGKIGFFGTNVFHRRIVMDFMKSRTEPIVGEDGRLYGYGRVGAGLRLKIELWTSDSSFDGSLVGLAASAKAKTASGYLSAQTIGVNNSDVTLSMPFSADFSEGSIQKVIEALAVIKSRLHDSEKTTLVPHFLAKISCVKKES